MADTLYDDIAGHSYLSPTALALGSGKFANNQEMAESLLGLDFPLFIETRDVSQTKLAIVMQINFQVAQGIDPIYIKSSNSSHTKQGVVYRDGWVDPRALAIIEQVKARSGIDSLDSRYGNVTSIRTE